MPPPAIREIATGLQFPEGPIAMPDGSILLVEIRRGTLTRVGADGSVNVVADLGGGPNGAAVGPDGRVYVCNNGGFEWHERPGGMVVPGNQPATYTGGSIQAVDLASGRVEVLYRRCGDVPLKGPNDLVFDRSGGFWFTDHGKNRERDRDRTGVFYARPDGSSIVEAIFPMDGPNGIGLSPAQDRLYVAETSTGRLFYWDLDGPGSIRRNPRSPNGGHFLAGVGGPPALRLARDRRRRQRLRRHHRERRHHRDLATGRGPRARANGRPVDDQPLLRRTASRDGLRHPFRQGHAGRHRLAPARPVARIRVSRLDEVRGVAA